MIIVTLNWDLGVNAVDKQSHSFIDALYTIPILWKLSRDLFGHYSKIFVVQFVIRTFEYFALLPQATSGKQKQLIQSLLVSYHRHQPV